MRCMGCRFGPTTSTKIGPIGAAAAFEAIRPVHARFPRSLDCTAAGGREQVTAAAAPFAGRREAARFLPKELSNAVGALLAPRVCLAFPESLRAALRAPCAWLEPNNPTKTPRLACRRATRLRATCQESPWLAQALTARACAARLSDLMARRAVGSAKASKRRTPCLSGCVDAEQVTALHAAPPNADARFPTLPRGDGGGHAVESRPATVTALRGPASSPRPCKGRTGRRAARLPEAAGTAGSSG